MHRAHEGAFIIISMPEHFSKPEAVHNWAKDQGGWCSGCSEFRFVTGIGYSHIAPWIYCCHVADFGKAAECSLAPIIWGEGLKDC